MGSALRRRRRPPPSRRHLHRDLQQRVAHRTPGPPHTTRGVQAKRQLRLPRDSQGICPTNRGRNTRQVPDVDPKTILGLGSDTTGRTTGDISRRLDGHRHLRRLPVNREHPETVQSQHGLGVADSVIHSQRSSSCGRRATTTMVGPLAAMVDLFLRYAPQFNAKRYKPEIGFCRRPTLVPDVINIEVLWSCTTCLRGCADRRQDAALSRIPC